MENSFQTSFIPKKPIVNNGNVPGSRNSTSAFMVISIAIIIISAAIAGGLFLYKGSLQKNKDQLFLNLMKVKDSFNEGTIAELSSYDKKSTVAKDILSRHMVLSPLFEAINEFTLSTIQYTKFDHTLVNDVFTVRMSGIARDYKSIALQADTFTKNKPDVFKNLIFSNLTKDKNNFVTFDVEFSVDPKVLLYSNNINNINTAPSNSVSAIDTSTPNPNNTNVNTPNPNNTNVSNNQQPLVTTNGNQ